MEYLGLNVADTVEQARGFVALYGWEWPQLHDPLRELAQVLDADYQPQFFLFDADGRLVGKIDGGGTAADWQALLDRL